MENRKVDVFDACALRRVSLADCFAMVLAIQEKGTLVTSDHHELDRVASSGLLPIHFIR